MCLLFAIGCVGPGEEDRDFEKAELVNEIDAPLVITFWRPFRAVRSAQLPPCGSTQIALDAKQVEDFEWFFQAHDGEASDGEALLGLQMTGKALLEANLTVHFSPDMASDSSDAGRKLRNLPCPDK
ncbi:MAG: hypothetical protein C1O27_001497 [Chloroflexi bacterium]|nr:MAG: hypothetical protein C1O27_001497 [Chloroflexota bacterium]